MTKKEMKEIAPMLSKARLEFELEHYAPKYKTERGFMNHLKKQNDEWAAIINQPDITFMRVDIEWHRSRIWGMCPTAEAWYSDANGSHYIGKAHASGWGYDKGSTVLGELMTKCAQGMLIRAVKRAFRSGKKIPYGCGLYGKKPEEWISLPHFEGGIGISCYRSIAVFLGGKMEWIEGKTWDRIEYTFNKNK